MSFYPFFLPEMHKMLLIYYSTFPIELSSGRHSRGKKQGDVNIQGEEFDSHEQNIGTGRKSTQSLEPSPPLAHTYSPKQIRRTPFTTKYKRATAKDEQPKK